MHEDCGDWARGHSLRPSDSGVSMTQVQPAGPSCADNSVDGADRGFIAIRKDSVILPGDGQIVWGRASYEFVHDVAGEFGLLEVTEAVPETVCTARSSTRRSSTAFSPRLQSLSLHAVSMRGVPR
ncbi:hypothetical protein GCM10023204_43540 [Actinomycetospora succinea]